MPKRPVEKTFTKTRIKKNDQVKVIAGRDKGKTGKVISVDRWSGKLIVEGVSMIKRHTRPNPQKQIKGGIAEKESSHRDFERDGAHLRRRAHAGGLQAGAKRHVHAARPHRQEKRRGAGYQGLEKATGKARDGRDSSSIIRRAWSRRW